MANEQQSACNSDSLLVTSRSMLDLVELEAAVRAEGVVQPHRALALRAMRVQLGIAGRTVIEAGLHLRMTLWARLHQGLTQ